MRRNTDYSAEMGRYETALSSDYKKQNGVFYTPVELCRRILREIKIRRGSVLLDPCCGAGSFLFAARAMGFTRLYGADQDEGAVAFCGNRLKAGTVKCLDTLGNDGASVLAALHLPEKADFVVGNPPYAPLTGNCRIQSGDRAFLQRVRTAGKNLFLAALLRSFELVKDGGTISYIIPKNFLHVASYGPLRKEILRQKTVVSIVDLGVCFKNVRGEQVVFTVKNGPPSPRHSVLLGRDTGTEFEKRARIPQNFYRDEIILFDSREEYRIYRKLCGRHPPLGRAVRSIARGRCAESGAVSGKAIRKFGYRDRKTPETGGRILLQNIYSAESGVIAAYGGNLEAGQTVTVLVPRESGRCRYILGLLHSRLVNFYLYKFCYNSSTLTMHTDAGYLGKVPYARGNARQTAAVEELSAGLEHSEYLSEEWLEKMEALNRLVYRIYGMSEEESAYIDRCVRKIQSKRWSNGG